MSRHHEAADPVDSRGTHSRGHYEGETGGSPQAEAARWFQAEFGSSPVPPLLIVIGLGQGHLLEEIDRRAPGTRVLAIEPDSAAAEALLARQDLIGWRTSGRLKHLAAPDYAGAEDAWRIFPAAHDAFRLITHPRLIAGPQTVEAARLAKKIVFGVRANAEARRRFAPRYLRNVVRNTPAIVNGRDVRALSGKYSGVPALITAAGPSLDDAIDVVRGLQTRALLIATDTTLRPLLGAGIVPHLVVGADPGQANARHFHELPDRRRTWLVAESALEASAAAAFSDRTLWFRLSNHHPWPWLTSLGVDVGQVEMWGSVLTAAFQVACLAGCDPIVIAGADLAFTSGRPYCRGTTYEFDWAYGASIGVPLAESWHAQMSRGQLRTASDIHGRDTTTTGALVSFRDWMVAHARRSGRRVINATGAGILSGDSIIQMPLAEALAGERLVPDVDAVLDVTDTSHPRLVAELHRLRDRLATGFLTASPLTEWQEFSGDGFDPAALGEALRAAAAALESQEAPRPPASVLPWSELAADGLAARTLTRLAERGEARSADDDPPGARHAALLDALRILDRVFEATAHLETLPVVHVSTERVVTSAAVRYLWPEPIRWALQLVEGLLGDGLEMPESGAATGCAGRASVGSAGDDLTAAQASLRLVRGWLRHACDSRERTRADAAGVLSRLDAIEAALWSAPRGVGSGEQAVLTVSAESGKGSARARLVLPLDATALAPALAGALAAPDHPIEIGRLTLPGMTIGVRVCASQQHAGLAPARILSPRLLMGGRPQSAIVCYAVRDGAVCVTPYTRHSLLVREDGTVEPHVDWPNPIVGELPFGEGGAVAWDNGMAGAIGARPPCVMYRRMAHDPVTVEQISIRPTMGAWWHGRLYWNCFPTPLDTWVGVASWSPGEDVRLEVPDVTLFGLLPDEDGLRLEPCHFRANEGYRPDRATEGLVLRRDGTVEATRLDELGQMSCLAEGRVWRASVHPERDLLRLRTHEGETRILTCPRPLRAEWIGGSLIVSTIDRRLLLFQDLERALAPGTAS